MPEIDRIATVADVFEKLGIEDAVFLGGSIIALLLTDEGSLQPRATEDVDVVLEIVSAPRYMSVTRKLVDAGHQPDQYGPACRWMIHGVPTDVMPLEESILGFSNRWYKDLVRHTVPARLRTGKWIRIASAPYLIASKLEAFNSRGGNDYLMSEDITDIVSVVDGRAGLYKEIAVAPEELQRFIRTEFARLVEGLDSLSNLEAHLPRDGYSHARAPIIRNRILDILNDHCA